MKLTVGQLLGLAGAALRSGGSGHLAENAVLRKLDQLCVLVAKTGMSEIEVEISKPTMSQEGKETLEKLAWMKNK